MNRIAVSAGVVSMAVAGLPVVFIDLLLTLPGLRARPFFEGPL